MKLQLAFVLLMAASCFAAKARYDNYKLYSLQLSTEEQAKAVVELEHNTDAYDFWSGASLVRDTDVLIPPHKLGEFEDFLDRFNIQHHIKVENIQTLIDEQDPELLRANRTGARFAMDWTRFYTFDEINAFIDEIVSRNANLSIIDIGQSFERRPLRVVRFSSGPNRPAVFVEANMHAREWATSATATWLIDQLVNPSDAGIRNLAETVDFYILVVANPDGFVFTHTSTRLWRKTRQPQGSCIGTDPNRNFDFFWMGGGASNNPCSDTYAGPRPFSEPETTAVSNFYGTIASRSRMFLSLHAFGQYLLMPFGHTTANSNFHEALMEVANAGAAAIRTTGGSDYLVGSTAVVLYTASGSSPDWAFGVHNTTLAYTFESRPIRGSSNGFLLQPAQIIPNNREIVSAIVAMVGRARAIGHM